MKLSKTETDEYTKQTKQHLLIGDFNTTSWGDLYQEWVQEEGLWELVNPTQPTITTGGCIDKYLYVPGQHIPTTFLQTHGEELGGATYNINSEEHYYPAEVRMDISLSAHYGVLLELPADPVQRPNREPPKILIKDIDEEGWEDKNLRFPRRSFIFGGIWDYMSTLVVALSLT